MILRLWQFFRPRIGWPTFLTLLGAAACLPMAIHQGQWVEGSAVLLWLALVGGTLGAWLADRQLRDRALWPLGLVIGGLMAFAAVGQTVPSPLLLFQAPGSLPISPPEPAPGYVDNLVRISLQVVEPLWFYGREFAWRNTLFGTQITRWVQVAISGGVSQDNDVFLLLMGWLGWSASFHSVVAHARNRHPALALAPLGLLITVAVAAARDVSEWLYLFLGLATILWADGVYLQRERRWVRERVDYSPDIHFDVALAGTLLGSITIVVAFTVATTIPWAGSLLTDPVAGPRQRVARALDRLFAGVRRPETTGTNLRQASFDDLPLSRVLGGPPELRDDPVLRVTADGLDDFELSNLYWRGLTYDRYTGRGWANTGDRRVRRPPQPAEREQLGPAVTQQIKLLAEAGPLRYAAARPVQVDVGATWVTRGEDDLVGWYADVESYTVVSRPTVASAEELRQAPTQYPRWVTERYLQLPLDLPDRVTDRAREIVGEGATPYGKAVAIEAAMRDVRYSLEVGPPPPDRDIVDYFLFDMEAGYCDYFATAMTVLSRAVGVPARIAIGYAMGTYDEALGAYVVTRLDAHAWVEVYFPGIGWVPFEPTPARSPIDRMSPPEFESVDRRHAPAVGAVGGSQWVWSVVLIVGGAGVVGLALWAVRRRRMKDVTPEERVRALYDALWHRAAWFGWDGRVGQTPGEQVEALERVLAEQSLQIGSGEWAFVYHGVDVVDDLRQLGHLFVKAQYSRYGVTAEEAGTADDAWRRLRWRLLLLWKK